MKLNIIINQTIDPKGGDIIQDQIILPILIFKIFNFWQFHLLNLEESLCVSKKILDLNARIYHHHMVFCILHHMEYI